MLSSIKLTNGTCTIFSYSQITSYHHQQKIKSPINLVRPLPQNISRRIVVVCDGVLPSKAGALHPRTANPHGVAPHHLRVVQAVHAAQALVQHVVVGWLLVVPVPHCVHPVRVPLAVTSVDVLAVGSLGMNKLAVTGPQVGVVYSLRFHGGIAFYWADANLGPSSVMGVHSPWGSFGHGMGGWSWRTLQGL